MKNPLKIITLSLLFSLLTPNLSFAQDAQDWIVRLRGIYVKTDVNSSVSVLGGHVATSSDQVPELDFTRFFTPNIAAELILATTQHDISVKGSVLGGKTGLGSVKLLPPTLTLQYHTNPTGQFRPYVGAGLNYTIFYGEKTGGAATSMKYKNNLGYALQIGADYMLDEKIGVNFDIKKVFLRTRVDVNNAYKAKAELDPWIIGAGVSYHF